MALYIGNQIISNQNYLGDINIPDAGIFVSVPPPTTTTTSTTTVAPTTTTTTQLTLQIGQAFQGGYIYSLSGSSPNYSGYIISNEESTIANTCWGCYEIRVPDARNAAIGTGLTNTNAIVDAGCTCFGSITAAQASLNYSGSGYTDWWLPTTGDWEAIFANETEFSFLTSSFEYWTSRENTSLIDDGLRQAYTAKWVNSTTSGSIQSRSKDSGLYFRAARAFTT
jgi:hypothetical protein